MTTYFEPILLDFIEEFTDDEKNKASAIIFTELSKYFSYSLFDFEEAKQEILLALYETYIKNGIKASYIKNIAKHTLYARYNPKSEYKVKHQTYTNMLAIEDNEELGLLEQEEQTLFINDLQERIKTSMSDEMCYIFDEYYIKQRKKQDVMNELHLDKNPKIFNRLCESIKSITLDTLK